jgi:large subunit ribosomal protein L29
MVLMKANNTVVYREKTSEELVVEIASLKNELFKLRFAQAMQNLANPMQLKIVRRNIARAKTLLREKQIS